MDLSLRPSITNDFPSALQCFLFYSYLISILYSFLYFYIFPYILNFLCTSCDSSFPRNIIIQIRLKKLTPEQITDG